MTTAPPSPLPLSSPLPSLPRGGLAAADRAAIRDCLATRVYGPMPPAPPRPWCIRSVQALDPGPLIGAAALERWCIGAADGAGPAVSILLAVPADPGEGPVPLVVGLCRAGLETVVRHPGWPRSALPVGAPAPCPDRDRPGGDAVHWSVPTILSAGVGVAIAQGDAFAPDDPAAGPTAGAAPNPGGLSGALSRWAWGLSRMIDALRSDPRIDGDRLWLYGHSRRGKAALWAAAHDPRIGAVVAHQSGCLGAALSRHPAGETVRQIVDRFPHWFCPDLATRADTADGWPCDQHHLLALCAPRPLLISNGAEDAWADPAGQVLALAAAAPAWGLSPPSPPSVGQLSRAGPIGALLLPGGHRCGPDYWRAFMAFLHRPAGCPIGEAVPAR